MLTILKEFYQKSMEGEELFSVDAENMRNTMPGDDKAEKAYYTLYNDVAETSEWIVACLNQAQNALLELNNTIFSPMSAEPFELCFEKKTNAPKENYERLITMSAAQAWKKLGEQIPGVMAKLIADGENLLQGYSACRDMIGEDTEAAETLRLCCLSIAEKLTAQKETVMVYVQTCKDAEEEVRLLTRPLEA